MDDKRTTYVTIGGVEYPMNFSVRAAQKVSDKYGGLERIGSAIAGEDTMTALGNVVWLVHLLIGQGVARKNLMEGTNDQAPSEDDLWTLLDMADLSGLQNAIMGAITAGAFREVETKADEKNEEAAQGG